jgi:glycosyltransferase involved in cell wall biosynthesis
MKLGFVNTSFRLGGAETVAHDLIEGCEAAGHATRFYVAAGKTYPLRSQVVPLYPRALSFLHHTRFHNRLERLAPRQGWTDRRFRGLASGWPDLVHVHNFHGDYATVASLAFVARRKPLVWTFHGHWGVTGGCDHPLECARYQQACGMCPRLGVWPLGAVDHTASDLDEKAALLGSLRLQVIAPSRLLANRIAASRVGRKWHVHHIPNGVAIDQFQGARKRDAATRRKLGLDPSATVVLVVNRNFQDPQKGFATIRDAVNAMPTTRESIEIALVGENADWAASQFETTVRLHAFGYVAARARIAALFEVADIFLFASPAENFPCVVLEAMASECCVVATPTSGVTEQIDDGVTGLLAADQSGGSLTAVLRCAIDDQDLRRRLGTAARQHVSDRFSSRTFLARHLALFDAVVAERTAVQ